MRREIWPLVGISGVLLAAPAWAHVGVGPTAGFAAGVVHPLSGLDHWVAMVAVGIWARLLGGRRVLAVPLGFLASMVLGSLVGMAGLPAVWAEPGILASVVFFAVLLLVPVRLLTWPGPALVALFAFFHGHAHGAEIPPGTPGWAYMLGFASTTALLHLLGILFGEGLVRAGGCLRRADLLVRLAGLGVLVLGMYGRWV